MSALAAVQEAIDAVLIADARFGTARVFDAEDGPPSTGWYVVIGDATEAPSPGNTHDDGRELTVTLHVWSDAKGMYEAQEKVGWLNGLLHRQPLSVTGWRTVSLIYEFSESLRDTSDGKTWRHIPVRYRVDLQAGA